MNREIITVGLALFAGVATAAFKENFSDKVFSGGVPEGWSEATQHETSGSIAFVDPVIVDGGNVLSVNFYSAKDGIKILYCETPVCDVTCDNINATVLTYHDKAQKGSKVDSIQVVVSTNNFNTFTDVGEPIDLQEIGLEEGRWVTNNVCSYIQGLSNPGQKVLIGYKFISAGRSGKYGYVGGLFADFVASATPTDAKFVRQDNDSGYVSLKTLNPGEDRACVAVTVRALPGGGISSTNVYATVTRNGVPTTQKLSPASATEYVSGPFDPPLDAGEEFSVSIHTTYTTYELPTLGTQDVNKVAHEYAVDVLKGTVTKRGSVWINEAVLDDDGLTIEFAGTTNRVITTRTNWRIVLSNEQESVEFPVSGKLDFKANTINGVVGLDVRRFGVVSIPDGTYVLELLNSCGISECTLEVVKADGGFSHGMVGIATWNETYGYSYDWEGTGIPGRVFDWGVSAKPTIGEQNEGQGFRVPFSTSIIVSAVTSAGTPLPYATVTVSATNVANDVKSSMESTFAAPTSEEGIAVIPFDGFSCVTDEVPVTISVAAFGWAADKISCMASLKDATLKNIGLSRVPAVDDCDVLRDYWRPSGNYKWAEATDGARKVLSLNLYSSPVGTNSTLQCVNALSPDGKKFGAISFDFRNTKPSGANYNEFCVVLGTNSTFSGAVLEPVVLSNKRGAPLQDKEWYAYRAFFELPEKFRESDIYLRIICRTKGGRSSAYVYLDNFRIAFQDVALPTELTKSLEPPKNGESKDFVLDVLPQATGTVSDVSAKLHIVTNDVEDVVDLAYLDGELTKTLAAAEGPVKMKATLGPFLTGDTVKYWAAVHYNSDDADADPMDVRYFPDDSYVNEDGSWVFEGEYGVSTNLEEYSFTVTGPALSIVGEPETTADGVRFIVHGYSADMLSDVTISIDGVEGLEQPFDYLSTNNQIRVTGEFVKKGGLSASTTYKVTITGKDGQGNPLETAEYPFVTKPLEPQITGTPKAKDGSLTFTNSDAFDFYALTKAEDVTKLAFHWTLNGTEVEDNTTTNYSDTVSEGTNTVTVYVMDWVDNVSPTNEHVWVYDKTAPKTPEITAGSFPQNNEFTTDPSYAFGAKSSDELSPFTIYWKLGRGEDTASTGERGGDTASTGESFEGSLKDEEDGTFVVSVWAVDKAGNVSETNVVSWTLDRAAPTNLKISEPPEEGVVTNCADFTFTASSDDLTARRYFWTTNNVDVEGYTAAELSGTAREGTNTVSVYAMDAAGNACESTNRTWVVDTIAPTEPEIDGKPDSITKVPGFSMTATSKDATRLTYHWTLKRGEDTASTGDKQTFSASALVDGDYTVFVYATDEAGNVSPTNSYSWKLDTRKPTNLKIEGEPQEGVVTNGTEFAFTASATDDTALKYYWTTNDVPVANHTAAKLEGPAMEGTNIVSVYAVDAAGNSCAPTNRTWVVDTIVPTEPAIFGKPAAITNVVAFSMTAVSEDATRLTYHWTLRRGEDTASTGDKQTFSESGLDDGDYAVFVYATDEAGNVSPTNSWNWTIDTKAPTGLTISGTPANGAITNVEKYGLRAEATDDHAIAYHWALDGRKETGTDFAGTVTENRSYTASVYATDAAGNVSETNTWSWTLDTLPPVLAEKITGTPTDGSVTNGPAFAYSITSTDASAVTYHWLTNGVWAADVTNFMGEVKAEGKYTVSVYATDAAGNVSEKTNSVSWTVDWTDPKLPVISGEPHDPITNLTWYAFTAEAEDRTPLTYYWKLGDGKVVAKAPKAAFEGQGLSDNGYQVSVYAVDAAGNISATNTWAWTVDTTPPTNLVVVSTPHDGDVTTSTDFEFKASAEDKTALTYHWSLNGGEERPDKSQTYSGVVSEGTNTMTVFARDAIGNDSETTNVTTWVVDRTPPVMRGITDRPAKVTNRPGFRMTADVTDNLTAITYHWTLKRGEDTASTGERGEDTVSTQEGPDPTFEGSFKDDGTDDGVYTVSVYATDEAKNVSATNDYEWVLDTIAPTVKLESNTPSPFNTAKAPMTVKVTFSEPVTNFTAASVTAENGKDVEVAVEEKDRVFTVSVNPTVLGQKGVCTNVTVKINAGEVRDAAGNPNPVASLTRTYDTRCPIVELTAKDTPEFFNDKKLPMKVTVAFSEEGVPDARVLGFSDASVDVTNGWVSAWSEEKEQNTFLLEITPKGDGLVTVVIPEGVVSNAVGNGNAASEPLTRTYDNTIPQDLALLGTPTNHEITAIQDFEFKAAAKDLTELTYTWQFNDGKPFNESSNYVFKSTAPKGTNTVSVYATDAAGNVCAAVTNTWIVDYEAPVWSKDAVTGEPGELGKTNVTRKTDFSYVAEATDDTRITYHWTTNGVDVAVNPTNLVGTATEGTNTVTVYAADQAKNVSTTNEIVWVVDTIAPTMPVAVVCEPPSNSTVNAVGYNFEVVSEDATKITYHWTLRRGEDTASTKTGEGPTIKGEFKDDGTDDGSYTVCVWAIDEAGNVSPTNSWQWTLDTVAPTVPAVAGTPADGSVTSNRTFRFSAESTDETTIAYSWALSDGQVSDKQKFSGEVKGEDGAYWVSVTATDAAGNASSTNWTWTLDTIAPTNLTLRGLPIADKPAKVIVTNGFDFAFAASAEDATAITYHWTTNNVVVTDCTTSNFVGTVSEGTNTVSVFAEDAAGNVCEPIAYTWVVDTRAPSQPRISGKPTDKATTNDCEYDFSASATDDWSGITFHWGLRRGEDTASTREGEGPTFSGKFSDDGTDDGSYAVSVWAIDEAGNVSLTNTISWTLDTIAPVTPTVTGTPEANSYTNMPDFNFNAALEKKDATAVTYHWTLLDGEPPVKRGEDTASTNFTGTVESEGVHVVQVYAKDAAGNVSPTNTFSWTYDATSPDMPQFTDDCDPKNGAITKEPGYAFVATAQDPDNLSPVTCHWLRVWNQELSEGPSIEGDLTGSEDGSYTVNVWAVDAAGNVSTTNSLSWTLDRAAPVGLDISGKPGLGAVTSNTNFAFEAVNATDLTALWYRWTFNNAEVKGNTTSNFVGVAVEGTNTVTVAAIDGAGNECAPVERWWVVDTIAPTNLRFVATVPGEDVLTNGTYFSLTALADDATQLAYHWTTNAADVADCETNNLVGEAVEGTNTVTVYVTDEAGNVSETNTVRWTVDLTPPTVVGITTEIDEDKVINIADVAADAFKVTVDFSEPVKGFTSASVSVDKGSVTAVQTNSASSYTVTVTPLPDYEGEINVQVMPDAVMDLAGNFIKEPSEKLTRTCDTKAPTVANIESNMPEPFNFVNLGRLGLVYTVTFSEPVTNFSLASFAVANGTVMSITTNSAASYAVKIEPQADREVSFQVKAGSVTDLAENGNAASAKDSISRKYDRNGPTELTITGTPTNSAVTASGVYRFEARANDLTEITYNWFLSRDGVDVTKNVKGETFEGEVNEEGVYLVQVIAVDEKGNRSSVTLSWTFKKGETPSGVDFGGGVTLPISPDGETNVVRFTAVDFRPGDLSTFVLSGFEATYGTIPAGFKMWFDVSNALDGKHWYVPVDENTASYADKLLTVTIDGQKTMNEDVEPPEPYKSFFIFGIDNNSN